MKRLRCFAVYHPPASGTNRWAATTSVAAPANEGSCTVLRRKAEDISDAWVARRQTPDPAALREAESVHVAGVGAAADVVAEAIIAASGGRAIGKPFMVLTGAGSSTESNVPDYRSPSGLYQRKGFKPLTAQDFKSETSRRRYWARSFLGFGSMAIANFNATHAAVDELATAGLAHRIVTQNVDGLHNLAANYRYHVDHFERCGESPVEYFREIDGDGSKSASPAKSAGRNHGGVLGTAQTTEGGGVSDFYVSLKSARDLAVREDDANRRRFEVVTKSPAPLDELHGNIHGVVCTTCGVVTSRYQLQRRLYEINGPMITSILEAEADASHETPLEMPLNPEIVPDRTRGSQEERLVRPDGDFAAPERFAAAFQIPPCDLCGGYLKPNVVLFGENVKGALVNSIFDDVERASAVLALGTSLQVFSAFRFIERAAKRGIPVIIINDGVTRGDPLATLKVSGVRLGTIMPLLLDRLKQ